MKIVLNEHNNKEVFNSVYGENKQSAEDLSGNLYMDVNALVLTQEEHNRILKAQSEVVKLFEAMQNLIQNQPELLEWLGIPKNLWNDVAKKKISNLTSYGRFDWMFDKSGDLQLLEFNAETPFGWKEASDYHEGISKYYKDKFINPNEKIKQLLKNSIKRSLLDQNIHPADRIAIIGDLMDEEEIETFDIIKKAIDSEEIHIESITDLKSLDNKLYLDRGHFLLPVDVLATFYSCEWMAEDEGANDFINALDDDSIKLVNPSSTLILHSKGLFALICYLYYEEGVLQEYAETIENYIPYTTFLEEEFKDDDKFVAKPLNHREGDGVEIRTSVSNIENDSLIYQDYIDSIELEYPLADKDFNRKNELLKPTIGTYLLDNKFGGYYTRLAKEICNSEFAVFAPTFIEKE